jgi:hypothetical protein
MCFSKEQETRPREKEREKKQRKQGATSSVVLMMIDLTSSLIAPTHS